MPASCYLDIFWGEIFSPCCALSPKSAIQIIGGVLRSEVPTSLQTSDLAGLGARNSFSECPDF